MKILNKDDCKKLDLLTSYVKLRHFIQYRLLVNNSSTNMIQNDMYRRVM